MYVFSMLTCIAILPRIQESYNTVVNLYTICIYFSFLLTQYHEYILMLMEICTLSFRRKFETNLVEIEHIYKDANTYCKHSFPLNFTKKSIFYAI